jgi:hypothetical protein
MATPYEMSSVVGASRDVDGRDFEGCGAAEGPTEIKKKEQN